MATYEPSRNLSGELIGILRLADMACIPLDPKNMDYVDFLAWCDANPDHGLDLSEVVEPIAEPMVPVEPDPLDAVREKLANGDKLTDDDIALALKVLLQ